MRIGNRKFERPTAEEMAAGQGYTPEELAAIEEAKHVLWKTELNLKDANALWMKLLAQVDVVALPPLRVASMVAQTRHIRFEARRNRREAYLNYFDACVPRRLRLYRSRVGAGTARPIGRRRSATRQPRLMAQSSRTAPQNFSDIWTREPHGSSTPQKMSSTNRQESTGRTDS